ncbi:MAG: cytochrome c peroxidase [Anaeromyxobacter sp.]
MACASCHDSESFGAPPNDLPVQLGGPGLDQAGTRQSPSIRYLSFNTAFFFDGEGTPTGGFFWDGRAASLADQAKQPFLNPVEMANADAADVVAKVAVAPYAEAFRQLFGEDVFDDVDGAYERIALALQQYQREDADLRAFTSKYDAFLRGQAQLTPQERRGLALFNSPTKGNCAGCHPSGRGADGAMPLFTDFTYDNLGVPRNPAIPANQDPDHFDLGLCARVNGDLAGRPDLCGAFKVPSLRNVAQRKVLFHNGRFTTLRDALTFYVQRDTNPEKFYPVGEDGQVRKFDDLPAEYHRYVNTTEAPYNRRPGDAPALSDAENRRRDRLPPDPRRRLDPARRRARRRLPPRRRRTAMIRTPRRSLLTLVLALAAAVILALPLAPHADDAVPAAPPPAPAPAPATPPDAPPPPPPAATGPTLSSYAEINFNRPRNRSEATIDLRRFVLGYAHRFSETTRVVAELEVEHAVTSADDAGEVAMEQAYVEHQFSPTWAGRAGLVLMPLGFINESHEPTAYFGVERNFVEQAIIPTTWREGAVQAIAAFGSGLTVQGGVATSFDLSAWDATSTDGAESPLGSIHQELMIAKAGSLSGFLAVDWRGVPGLRLGAAAYGGNATHGQPNVPKAGVLLWDAHARWTPGRFDLSAVYAMGAISNTAELNATLIGNPTLVPERFDGWYGQAGYKLWASGDMALWPFVRYEQFNTGRSYADLGDGLTPAARPTEAVLTLGANYELTRGVVVKVDVQKFREDDDRSRFDVGLGWSL